MKLDCTDPFVLKELLWPDVYFYDRQREVIESVRDNKETYVPAGNMLGKDFVAGFICLWFFLTRTPCRVVTTSAKDDHLRVLWGEINRYVQTSKYSLKVEDGGPLIVNHQEIKRVINGQRCPLSYMKGLVASPDSIAAMQGHHIANTGDGIPRTLFVSDESSSVPDDYHKMAATWFRRALLFGNTWECNNFFRRGIDAGDLLSKNGKYFLKKVIKIKATDSPNIRLALAQIQAGMEPTGEVIVPGVKDWETYQENLATWDQIQQCVCLDAEFYKGAELLLLPPLWLNRAEAIAARSGRFPAKAIGVDTAEGGDKTAIAIVGDYGLIDLRSVKTPDTSVIPGMVIDAMREFHVDAKDVMFDAGGGGKEHSDAMRSKGFKVRTVAFGEAPTSVNKFKRMKTVNERRDEQEERQVYKNRRAEMYGMLRQLLNPSNAHEFGIPAHFSELRRQLSPIPLRYDGEGRMVLPPKHRKNPDSQEITMTELIGHSPDEADAFVVAVFCMRHKPTGMVAGAL